MINIRLEGHHFEHDIFELIRVFYPDRPINFIREQRGTFHGLYIESYYDEIEKSAKTILYYSKEKILENKIFISEFKTLKYLKNPEIKIIKSSLYEILSKYTKINLPWGILTGIRPVKIAHNLLNMNIEEEDAYNCLINLFKLDEKRTDLIINIAKNQKEYISENKNSYSLYINIPFCPSICVYCSFPTVIMNKYKDMVPIYIEKVLEEIYHTKKLMGDLELYSVYIGGGTPSAIPVKDLEKIILEVKRVLGEPKSGEFTVECGRADTITTPLLRMLSSNGINRISINPQTMNDETLKTIGRKHSEKEVIEAFNLAKRLGIDIINMDLIIGLPGEKPDDIRNTLNKILKLEPKNLTVHTLSLKKGSNLRNKGHFRAENEEIIKNMIDMTYESAIKNSYQPYYLYRQKNILGNFENIGYSKKSKACVYNIISMEEIQTIVGIGMGAVSKFYFPDEDRIERVANFKSIEEYIKRFHEQLKRKEKYGIS